jgi:manganese transport protein
LQNKHRLFGPAILVTAAFIGPGTVMTASRAGSDFGFLMLWAIAFSVVATIVLQEMAARVGIVTGQGLSLVIKNAIENRIFRVGVLGLILIAILIGNSAYQTGNILGAAAGLEALFPSADPNLKLDTLATIESENRESSFQFYNFRSIIISLIAAVTLTVIWIGRIDLLQKVLTVCVGLMSCLFIYSAFASAPQWTDIAAGFVPRIPSGSEWFVIGIIGTTVVPYNLFLHASAAAQQWGGTDATEKIDTANAIKLSRIDTIFSVALGGLVTGAILITASMAFHNTGTAAGSGGLDIAKQLEPALGTNSKFIFSIGLFAAGLTSAITAPVAAAFAVSGCFGWSGQLSDRRLKITATTVVLIGLAFAIWLGKSPQQTIILAQAANGLLLPLIAVLLIAICNRKTVMKSFKNGRLSNGLGILILLITAVIAVNQMNSVKNKIRDIVTPPKTSALKIHIDSFKELNLDPSEEKSV